MPSSVTYAPHRHSVRVTVSVLYWFYLANGIADFGWKPSDGIYGTTNAYVHVEISAGTKRRSKTKITNSSHIFETNLVL